MNVPATFLRTLGCRVSGVFDLQSAYQALNYLVAEVNYGGRVTDEKDGRCMRAMLKKYFTPEVMQDGYKLSKLDTYYAPSEGSFEEALEAINRLPLDEDPEVFGLHSNANMTYE